MDYTSHTVRFPSDLVEETIAGMQADLAGGREPKLLNGVTISKSRGPVQSKFGGACIEVFKQEPQSFCTPTHKDLIDLVRLGQALPEVATVGNPVAYLIEEDGRPVGPRLRRVKTGALIALYTDMPGPTEAWNTTELDFLVEIGEVVRSRREEFLTNPCFVTAKEAISPRSLDVDTGAVLPLLAKRAP